MFGSLSLTLALFNSPDYGKGKTSALKVFNMIDSAQEGKPDSSVQDGSRDILVLFLYCIKNYTIVCKKDQILKWLNLID